MGFWSRRREAKEARADVRAAEAIPEFWSWWAGSSGRVEQAMADGTIASLSDEITARVEAIAPGLAWEIGGEAGSRSLVVTAEGDPALRGAARRWLLGAPQGLPGWRFSDMRLPSDAGWVLSVGETMIDSDDLRFAVERRGSGLDVVVAHPAFAHLDEMDRGQISMMALDQLVGEADVELWIDGADAPPTMPEGAGTLADLRAAIEELRSDVVIDGAMSWVILSAETPTGPMLVRCLSRLSPVQAPQLETHVELQIPYTDLTAEGFPGEGSFSALEDLEGRLEEALAGQGVVAAVVSHAGRRTIHLFVDPASSAVERVRDVVATWPQGAVTVASRRDPAWEAVQQFRA